MRTPPPTPQRKRKPKRKKTKAQREFKVSSPLIATGSGVLAVILVVCILLIGNSQNNSGLSDESRDELAQSSSHADNAESDVSDKLTLPPSAPKAEIPENKEAAPAETNREKRDPVEEHLGSTEGEVFPPSSPATTGNAPNATKSVSPSASGKQTGNEIIPPRQADLPKLTPRIPEILLPIDDEDFTRTREAIRRELRAVDGLVLFEAFSKSHDFTERQRGQVTAELEKWKTRAKDNQYRLGTQWVSEEAVKSAENEANELLAAAEAAAERKDWEQAIQLLETASRANPNSIRPDYILGLFYSLPFMGANGPEKAEQYFDRVLAREPNDPPALNSRAIARMKQHRFGFAIRDLKRANELLDGSPEVGHNLGRFLQLAEESQLKPSARELSSGRELYDQILNRQADCGLQEATGWLHMLPIIRNDNFTPPAPAHPDEGGQKLRLFSEGTGFLIADEYFLTNRHVIHDDRLGIADRVSVEVTGPDNSRPVRFGTIVAIADDVDLAILHIPEATGEPLPLIAGLAELASDILILGYPKSDVLGAQLKATQGVIAGLPSTSESYYLLDATSDHGNSGGPILNRAGGVVSILTVGYRSAGVLADVTGGIPSQTAFAFVKQHLTVQPMATVGIEASETAEWSKLAKKYATSVVQVKSYYQAGISTIDRVAAKAKVSENIYEDKTCATCSGHQRIACEIKNCIKGEIQTKRMVTRVVGNNNLKRTITVPVFSKVDCNDCVQGTVDCPFCSNGFDHRLR